MISEIGILHPDEVARVLAFLRKRKSLKTHHLNLIIFRLACCCGLRRKEIANLNLQDLLFTGKFPAVRVRGEATKASSHSGSGTGRYVPLWLDQGTLDDLAEWCEYRRTDPSFPDTGPSSPVVCCVSGGARWQEIGGRLSLSTLTKRWTRLIEVLGEDRQRQTTLHSGRHTYVSHALHSGRSLVEVARAAGHKNIATTSLYSHLIESTGLPDIFGPARLGPEPEEKPEETNGQYTGRRRRWRPRSRKQKETT